MTLEQIGVLTGILSAVFTGVYFLVKDFKEKRKKLRIKISGEWGNEGDVFLSKVETHFVELELEADIEDGEITGTIQSRVVLNETISPLCSVNGKLKFTSAEIQITHLRHGELLVLGKAKLKYKKKVLHWNLIEGVADFFPNKTKLVKYNDIKNGL
jgi:hypothetical protein